ncbi:short-chain dehydrogenase/reductase [Devosia pacifica]|uniref:Short-chain dehydrogenase/reductase n=1 Tax=Devosia pacifica TaxID=1335967 RepID=A0A918VSA2_9HYPH|nr:SDR family oxidoreductase [Devosia pacifica]GHA18212.1 short-chain dehydrogenase/reductase [Devosia pacifica]
MKLGLEKKRALVIGASKGLGAATAIALANEGATVIGASRSVDAISALSDQIDPASGGSIIAHALDLADPASVTALAEALVADGGVDIIVNNSGGPPPGEAHAVAPDTFSSQFDIMVRSLIEITQKLLPQMREKNWGRILTLTSSGVEVPLPRLAISNSLRQALVGWSKTLANEVAADGVTVNIIVQGRIHTDRVDQLDEGNAKRQNLSVEEVRTRSKNSIPMRRYGRPEELADTVLFLVSERSSYITGTRIRVDGGLIAAV